MIADQLAARSLTSVFEAGISEASLQMDYDEEVASRSIKSIHDIARADDGRPFFLIASFSQPHDPWKVPRRYWDIYKDASIDPPVVPSVLDDVLDPHSRRIREMCDGMGIEVPHQIVLNARRAHYAAISYVDSKLGLLMDALGAMGLRDDTVVIASTYASQAG